MLELTNKIDIYKDNFQSAVYKKRNNTSLSMQSRDKIKAIINLQYNFKSNEAVCILDNISEPAVINYQGVSSFSDSTREMLKGCFSDYMKTQIRTWRENSSALLKINRIGKGARGCVYKRDMFAIKIYKHYNNLSLMHEAKMCNDYNRKKNNLNNIAVVVNNSITMPYLSGKTPSASETLSGIKELYDLNFLMGDAKPENFIKCDDGHIYPIDFGLIFEKGKLTDIDVETQKNIIHDYVKGGFRCIPAELKADYKSCMGQLDEILGKDSPLRKINLKELSRAGLYTPV